jgi:hypothetical protein
MSREVKNTLALLGAIAVTLLISFCAINDAKAGGSHHNHTTTNVTNNYSTVIEEGDTIVNESGDEDSGSAAAAAMSQCHPSAAIQARQNCIGVGHDLNTDNTAVTYGHYFRGKLNGERAMYGGSITLENHQKAVVGFGVNF